MENTQGETVENRSNSLSRFMKVSPLKLKNDLPPKLALFNIQSKHYSSGKPACRICFGNDCLITPCSCKGTTAYVHSDCLEKWFEGKNPHRLVCEICKGKLNYRIKNIYTFSCRKFLFLLIQLTLWIIIIIISLTFVIAIVALILAK